MDFYIIELKEKIKIGISKSPKKRVNSLQLTSGYSDKEIISLQYFENASVYESRLKRLFHPYQTKGEWFSKKDIVKSFIDKINNGSPLNNELIEELKYNQLILDNAFFKQAKKTYEKIKVERKGIGFPDSVSVEKILKTNKVGYKHIDYILSNDFKTYTRKLKFEIDKINQTQLVQCLKTIKNISKNIDESNFIQEQIDKIFNAGLSINEFQNLKDLIRKHFDSKKYIRHHKTDLRIKLKEGIYYFEVNYCNLNSNEYAILKKGTNVKIFESKIVFDYKDTTCECAYDYNDRNRVLNFFKNKNIKIVNKTDKDCNNGSQHGV